MGSVKSETDGTNTNVAERPAPCATMLSPLAALASCKAQHQQHPVYSKYKTRERYVRDEMDHTHPGCIQADASLGTNRNAEVTND